MEHSKLDANKLSHHLPMRQMPPCDSSQYANELIHSETFPNRTVRGSFLLQNFVFVVYTREIKKKGKIQGIVKRRDMFSLYDQQ